ncbi:MAG: nucleotidyltransferase family protein [Armatimonadetes bacterium]|nr:nucleotidyltransferase family protein [Armatimonadota bacterium]
MDAVVIAGGRIHGELVDREGVGVKALLNVNSSSLLERAVAALRATSGIGRICVVGPREVEGIARGAGADLFADEGATGIDNIMRGLDALGARGHVLCAASDLPFVRPGDIEKLIESTPPEAQLGYAIFSRGEFEALFPGGSELFAPLSDGDFRGGSIVVLDADLLRAIEPVLQRAFAARKSVSGMARLFGPVLFLRIVLGRFVYRPIGPSSEDVRRRAEHMLSCGCAIVRGCSPRLAADVDDLEDWNALQHAFSGLSDAAIV